MAEETKSLTPERFWELYADKLNEEGEKPETHKAYQDNTMWTKIIVDDIAKKVISDMLGDIPDDGDSDVDSEYFKIDLIGYTTKWSEPRRKGGKKQHDWKLKIAYEHENDAYTWHDELCKLCHIVADLRVISSYYDFSKKKKIEELLQDMINKLGMWRIHRVPNSHWLFVFGPWWVCKEKPFRAFTIDSELKVVEITGDKKVIPGTWIS